MDIPIGTLKSRLNRARKKLKNFIKKSGTFLSDDSLIDEGRKLMNCNDAEPS